MPGKLYVLTTPIGNLKDITLRAIEILKSVDFLVVEDTRVTLKLLNHLGLKKPMFSYFRHSNPEKLDLILQKLQSGETAAIISDAGTPCISDPGEELVKACIEHGIKLEPIPGANAALSALVASGLNTTRFCFEGFLPMNKKNRTVRLRKLQQEERTIIFYEAPHKLISTLKDMQQTFGGERKICFARELTKIHEQFLRFCLAQAVEYFEHEQPKGEFVLVLEGAREIQDEKLSEADIIKEVQKLQKTGKSKTEIAKELAEKSTLSKREIYNLLHS